MHSAGHPPKRVWGEKELLEKSKNPSGFPQKGKKGATKRTRMGDLFLGTHRRQEKREGNKRGSTVWIGKRDTTAVAECAGIGREEQGSGAGLFKEGGRKE